jgi:hypothetical protein
MTPQAKQDAKILWKAIYATNCIEHSAKAAMHILAGGVNYNDPLYAPLMNSVYVLYARPFLDSGNVGILSEKLVPKDLLSAHKDAIQIRHQLAAHRDSAPTVLPSGIPAPHLRVTRKQDGAQIAMSEVYLDRYKFDWMLKLCAGVLKNLQKEVDRILTTYLPELAVEGEYVVNITDPNGPFFVPAPAR